MFDYLTLHDGPVVKGLEQFETVYAKDQPQYLPMRTLPGENGNSAIARFSLTPEQREAIAGGADILLEILHYRGPLAPSRMMVSSNCDIDTDNFRHWFRHQTRGPYQLPFIAAKEENPCETSDGIAAPEAESGAESPAGSGENDG